MALPEISLEQLQRSLTWLVWSIKLWLWELWYNFKPLSKSGFSTLMVLSLKHDVTRSVPYLEKAVACQYVFWMQSSLIRSKPRNENIQGWFFILTKDNLISLVLFLEFNQPPPPPIHLNFPKTKSYLPNVVLSLQCYTHSLLWSVQSKLHW